MSVILARPAQGGTATGLTKLTTASTVDDSNKVFVFSRSPTYLVINGVWYDNSGGAYTWTGTTTVTLSAAIGTGSTIWGFA